MVVYELFPPASLRMPRMVTKLINLQKVLGVRDQA